MFALPARDTLEAQYEVIGPESTVPILNSMSRLAKPHPLVPWLEIARRRPWRRKFLKFISVDVTAPNSPNFLEGAPCNPPQQPQKGASHPSLATDE